MTWVLDRPVGKYLIDTVVKADETASVDELVAQFRDAFAQFGVSYFSCSQAMDASGQATAAVHFGARQPEWTKHYRDKGYAKTDPLLQRTLYTAEPFFWSDPFPSGKPGQTILGEAAEHGLKDGFVLPVHQRDGSVSGVLLTSDQRFDLSPDERAGIILLSTFFAWRGQNLALQSLQTPRPSVVLTKRQRQCLQWARAGKTAWEIGEIVGISEHTAIFHLEEARKRLGVNSTSQAVLEAVRLGLIEL